jgi:hypothetical protein
MPADFANWLDLACCIGAVYFAALAALRFVRAWRSPEIQDEITRLRERRHRKRRARQRFLEARKRRIAQLELRFKKRRF